MADSPIRSRAEAAARLDYVAAVRTRARRASLLPSLGVLLVAGVIITAHGLLIALWPHRDVATAGWVLAVMLARPLLRQGFTGGSGELVGTRRLWMACAAAGVVAIMAAIGLGLDPLLTGIAAVLAMRAQLAGLPVVAGSAALTGLMGDLLLMQGAPGAAIELPLGVALMAAGLAARNRERRQA